MKNRLNNKVVCTAVFICTIMSMALLIWCFIEYNQIREQKKALRELLTQGYKTDFEHEGEVCYQLIYLDNDHVPEVCVAVGNGHADRVNLYIYDESNYKYCLAGEFGIFGEISVLERKGRIACQYGGGGLYFDIIFELAGEGNNWKVITALGYDGTGEEEKYYFGFPVPDELPLPKSDVSIEWMTMSETYQLSEKGFDDILKKVGDAENSFVRITYDSMSSAESLLQNK